MTKKEKVSASVRFDADIHSALERIAEKEHRTFSHQVQHLVAQALAAQQQRQAA